MRFRRRSSACGSALGLAVVLALGSAACGDAGPRPNEAAPAAPATDPALTGKLTVLAAASLSESFQELGAAFEAKHPGSEVAFSFDASSALAAQVNGGAPADLFASADQQNMKKVTDAGNAADPRVFAHNRLAIIVEKGNPRRITALADFDRPGVTFVLCAVEVPCGRYSVDALARAGVKAQPKSYETNVKAVVRKVTSGEVDAGIGYATDAQAAAATAEGVAIPEELNVSAEYPMAVLRQSANPTLARAFCDFILSAEAQAVLARYGFSA